MSIPSTSSNEPPLKERWSSIRPYIAPPLAAAAAIVPAFPDMIRKSALQTGKLPSGISTIQALREGLKASPVIGATVGSQMLIQKKVEKMLAKRTGLGELSQALVSSGITGALTTPLLAIFNGQTMGRGPLESLRNLSPRQALAIAAQEAAFVGGLSAADLLAKKMREKLGENKAVDYTAAYVSGALGSLAGHPANTALTRWQSGMSVRPSQLMWGSVIKAKGVGIFSVIYKLGKDLLTSSNDETSTK